MPFQSQAQKKWALTPQGTKQLGKKTVAKWLKETGKKRLPKRVKKKK